MREGRREVISFADDANCDRLVSDLKNHPHAFVIACVSDRQMPAKRAWKIPYKLRERIGSFEFKELRKITKEKLLDYFKNPSSLHRFDETISACVYDAIQIIGNQYGGDAAKMWSDGPSSAEVVYRFLQIHGVGPKIATMAANILVRHFKVKLKDHYSIDVSVDTHVKRVFQRLGLTKEKASPEALIYRARGMYPEFPGIMDFPCWRIGQDWCRSKDPKCDQCYMRQVCPTARGLV